MKGKIMNNRVFNFSAGPATLPLSVLQKAQEELLSYNGEGLSVLEMSHRSKSFTDIIDRAVASTKKVMGFDDNYTALFLQGGATGQFSSVPLNLAIPGKPAQYINTGAWSKKAIAEVKKLNIAHEVIASSAESNFNYIPKSYTVSPNASYLHITSNNTIFGTQWKDMPETGDVPLVVDMSSDIYCKKFDPNKIGLLYAGAQSFLSSMALLKASMASS